VTRAGSATSTNAPTKRDGEIESGYISIGGISSLFTLDTTRGRPPVHTLSEQTKAIMARRQTPQNDSARSLESATYGMDTEFNLEQSPTPFKRIFFIFMKKRNELN
jgi:hypothetical protein